MHKKSKKAFKHNVEAEMHAGKPQDQSLAIAYSVKRKAKKAAGGSVQSGSPDMNMAKGGLVNESAVTEQRPMPSERDNDRAEVSRNSGNKPPARGDSFKTGEDISYQAKKGMKTTRIKHPKMVPQSGYTARLRSEEDNLQSSARVNNGPQRQPPEHDNEEGANRQGPKVRDMQDEHSTHRKPYAKGGEVESSDYRHPMNKYEDDLTDLHPSEDEGASMAHSDNEERPDRQGPAVPDMEEPHNDEEDKVYGYAQGGEIDLHHDMDEQPDEADLMKEASLAAAIMAKRRRMAQDSDSDIDHEMYMAEGGEIHSHPSIYSDDSDQVDLSRNADEDANEEDQLSFNALRRENYSESEGLRQLDQPEDSNLIDDPREDREENIHDRSIVGQIRKKMRVKSPISR